MSSINYSIDIEIAILETLAALSKAVQREYAWHLCFPHFVWKYLMSCKSAFCDSSSQPHEQLPKNIQRIKEQNSSVIG